MPRHVVVVGAGAGGMMAAGQAAFAGARVTLFEKMRQPGRKLRITGKGRCNLTNSRPLPDFLEHFFPDGRFLRQAFHRFFTPDLVAFFATRGLDVVEERGGRIFPASGRAADVVQALEDWLRSLDVELVTMASVQGILEENGRACGVQINGRETMAEAVILASGGASYPRTGSAGDGYRLAEAVGHRIVALRPALVPLEVAGKKTLLAELAGLNLRNVGVRLEVDGKLADRAFGEVCFTGFGLGGPVILTLSSRVVDFLAAGRKVAVTIDLKPALDEQKLDARLIRDLTGRCRESMRDVLRGLVPRELVGPALQATAISGDMAAGEIRSGQRLALRHWLKHFRLEISGSRPIAEALVTAGGVDLAEIDPRTMESRLLTGLYFCGELLDIQADTGGYNLQAAFSTGWLAGNCAAVTRKT
ncbi:MAG: aminoacetone oxidase family FAD-binding enzyme [Deltaproteobacteria bacterium]|nr:MAG: aminoacetone oxidase family FAD-binding enzyme [Deltaproteobacteria bacterium]